MGGKNGIVLPTLFQHGGFPTPRPNDAMLGQLSRLQHVGESSQSAPRNPEISGNHQFLLHDHVYLPIQVSFFIAAVTDLNPISQPTWGSNRQPGIWKTIAKMMANHVCIYLQKTGWYLGQMLVHVPYIFHTWSIWIWAHIIKACQCERVRDWTDSNSFHPTPTTLW